MAKKFNMTRKGIIKRTPEGKAVQIHKPKPEQGKFYHVRLLINDNITLICVSDLTDTDLITKAKRKVKTPSTIHVKILRSWTKTR
jgi:hypothetical protein